MKLKIISIILLIFTISISLARTGARYLIITPDSYVPSLQPLAEWKTKKGVKAIIAPLSITGSSASQIKNYILNAYNNWEIRPEFVLLAGHGNVIPYSGNSDDYYADMTGDYKIELSIARFPCSSVGQIDNIVNKILHYERTPFLDDTLWFRKGTTIAREDGSAYPPTSYPDTEYWADARYCFIRWLNNGYVYVDSFSKNRGHGANDVVSAINNGRAYIVFRGQSVTNWWTPFQITPENTTNGYKLPVIVSGTCATMSLSSSNYLGDMFINAGSSTNPKGSVGFFGTTVVASSSGLAQQRGTVSKGFHQALFEERTYSMGDVAKRAKFILDSIRPSGFSQTRYQEWELFGDPELQLWTGTPQNLVAIYDSVVPLTQTVLPVLVQTNIGLPVAHALVCIRMDTTIYSYEYTNSQGQINLPMQTSIPGVMDITITAHNYKPCERSIRIIPANVPYVVYDSCIVNDSPSGNNDGKINPGEIIRLQIFLQNSGGVTASGVQARLYTNDPLITISDSIENFGTITPGAIVGSQGFYTFSVSPNCYNNYQLNFQLYIHDEQNDNWASQFSLPVYAGKVVYSTCFIIDTLSGGNNNSRLGPGENALMRIRLQNIGSSLDNCIAILHNQNPYVIITDSMASFGTIVGSGLSINYNDPFAISAAPNLPRNYQINFLVSIIGQGGTYIYNESFTFPIITETGTSADPTGPDAYGYWAYDNTDTISGQAPVYNWFEIGPAGPGLLIDSITNRDAAVVTLPLPFTFRYYGQNYDSISVCCNGFLAMGRTSYRLATNSGIPDSAGPSAMIAPFWCDLNANENTNPPGAGDIYQYYDASNHRWIVEFYDIAHYGQTNVREKFQVIVLDPVYYPTATGDGEIIYVYSTVANPSVSTIGIENQTESYGIQYAYNNNYNSTAATLINGRAIKFTTQSPTNFQVPWIVLIRGAVSDSIGGNNNGIPEPNEIIRLVTYLRNSGSVQAQNTLITLRNIDGEAVVIDSIRNFGNILPSGEVSNLSNPYIFQIVSNPADTILDFILQIQAQNYSNVQYFSIGIQHHPGIEDNPTHNVTYYSLKQNHPNPFRFTTTIEYSLPSTQHSEIKIYNTAGRLVRTLVSENQVPGFYRLKWDGKDESKRQVSSGIYYYILTSSNSSKLTRKMILY